MKLIFYAILGPVIILAACAWQLTYAIPARAAAAPRCDFTGLASWYGPESGNTTATGEHFDGSGLTAAMPDRKHLGERYRVHYGHFSVDVRINDVGPRKDLHRIIDLSRDAAIAIGLIGRGIGTVCLERIT